jgi:hypothetical protein
MFFFSAAKFSIQYCTNTSFYEIYCCKLGKSSAYLCFFLKKHGLNHQIADYQVFISNIMFITADSVVGTIRQKRFCPFAGSGIFTSWRFLSPAFGGLATISRQPDLLYDRWFATIPAFPYV